MRIRLMAVGIAGILSLGGCGGGSGSGSAAGPSDPAPASLPLMPPGPTRPTGTVAERRDRAEKLIAEGDLVKAIGTLEEGLMIDAKDRATLSLLADSLRRRAREVAQAGTTEYYTRLVSAAEYYRRLRESYPELTDAEKKLGLELFYDEATAHARSLRVEEATGSLRDLVGAGFKDFDRIRRDPDWAGILALSRFRSQFDEIAGTPRTEPNTTSPPGKEARP